MIKDELRIGLDIDDTIVCWMEAYLQRFGTPKNAAEITRRVQNNLKNDKTFWMNLKIKNRPNFKPTLFCTARVIKKTWTKQYIHNVGLPDAPVYQVYGYGIPKSPRIKGLVDVFIDDSVVHFKELNNNGVPCLLIDTPFNREFQTPFRIYSLDLDEIFNTYQLMMPWILN